MIRSRAFWLCRNSALALCSFFPVCCTAAMASSYHLIDTFGAPPDANGPNGGLVKDAEGRLYGVTSGGGTGGFGTIYRLTPSGTPQMWSEEVIHSFTGSDGQSPSGALLVGPSGELYGTAAGGETGYGTVYRLDETEAGWVLTVLHQFQYPSQTDGGVPTGAPIFGPDGLLYGTTVIGGLYGAGTAYSVSPQGDVVNYQAIHAFGGEGDGGFPESPLYPFGAGFVGTTNGNPGRATVFTLSLRPTGVWAEKPIYVFGGSGALANPVGNIVRGVSGALYGCATGGFFNQGGIFSLQHTGVGNAPWAETVLYSFGAVANDPLVVDGPEACGLALNSSGQLLGMSTEGGAKTTGAFFELTPSLKGAQWTETILHDFVFGAPKGAFPAGGPLRSGNNYYGATANTSGPIVPFGGTVYDLNPVAAGR